jgi:hypothetical protein
MDGDSIGGSVNLVMKQAPEKLRLFGSIGGGYNELLSSFEQNNYSFTAGRRFNGSKMGIIASGSGSGTNRGNQDMEVVYTPTLTLNELNPRWYQVKRRRVGFTGAFDVKPNTNTAYTVRAVFNRFIDDHENRQRVRYAVANRRIDRELRDRTHIERISSLSFTGQHIIGGSTTFDYQLLGAYSDQNDPLTMTTVFRHTNVNFAPNVTATSIDPDNVQANPQNEVLANYNFNSQLRAVNFSMDRDVVVSANLRRPLRNSAGSTSLLKVGFKYRDKAKGRNRNEVTYTTASTLKLTNFSKPGSICRPISTAATTCRLTPARARWSRFSGRRRLPASPTTRATPRTSTAPRKWWPAMPWPRSTPARNCCCCRACGTSTPATTSWDAASGLRRAPAHGWAAIRCSPRRATGSRCRRSTFATRWNRTRTCGSR